MHLPTPRGPVSRAVRDALRGSATLDADDLVRRIGSAESDVLLDADLQLALWTAYELHYGGFELVDDRWEWDPGLLGVRRALEDELVARVRDEVGPEPVLRTASDVVSTAAMPFAPGT